MEGITMTYTNRRDFLKTVTATAVLTAIPPVQAKETPTMSKENFADVNGQHIFYSVHGAGKPLILLHGGINPDIFRRMGARQTPTGHCAVKRWATTLPL